MSDIERRAAALEKRMSTRLNPLPAKTVTISTPTHQGESVFAADIADEAERMRRRHLHAARPRGPLSMEEAQRLAERMAGKDTER
jgi:hypothetical protein